jgi:hypothetical protein
MVQKIVVTCEYTLKYKHAEFRNHIDFPYENGGKDITDTGTLEFTCYSKLPTHWRQIVRSRLKTSLAIDSPKQFTLKLSSVKTKSIREEEKKDLISMTHGFRNITINY